MQLAKKTPESPLNTPRARLDGLDLGRKFVLPSLELVRADAVRSREMKTHPDDFKKATISFDGGRERGGLPLPLIFNSLLPSLFKFSYFVQVEDVPADIMEDCIWALSLFIRVMEECSEEVLRTIGHVKAGNDYRRSKYFSLINARGKIVLHLLQVGLSRPRDALPYAKAMSWLLNPMPFEVYGEALVLTRTDDEEALKALKRAMLGITSANFPADAVSQLIKPGSFWHALFGTSGESWLINWFRKNPHLMHDSELRYLLLPVGPILDGLGGESWLESDNRKETTKTDQRLVKACRTCRAREPLATLSRCNNCKYIYYCSKDCQRAHWKGTSAEMAAQREKTERLSETDPQGAKRAADWSLWCNSTHDATQFGLISALGLHRDPARGRTHIVLKQVEYVPTAAKLKHKFRVAVMRLDRGEGQEYIDGLLAEMAATHGDDAKVPFLDLSFGEGVSAWLGSGATTVDGLRARPYDRDWQKRFNLKTPPEPMELISGAKDAEHVF
ncbi:hypothetical protein B0H10DRAFT_2068783 [Mycena sp. CBHHK59/15]|nr:hypothetical protein B0H10DRAFT_2068783 [Mycena sp. CBHHK59/15]